MRRRNNKLLRGCASALALLVVLAMPAKGAETKPGAAPPMPELPGSTTTAATPPATPPAPKKRHVVKHRGEPPTQTVTIELPPSDDVYPDKPGAAVVDRNCLSCHSPEIVANQPSLTRAQWAGVIDTMRKSYGAPIAADDQQTILDYLVSLRGEARQRWR